MSLSDLSTPAPRILYICSGSRCGSTVLDMFLGAHPQIASLGECNMLPKVLRMARPCTCGQAIGDCASWGRVFDTLKAKTGVDLRETPYGLPLWDARARYNVDREYQDKAFEWRFRAKAAWLQLRHGIVPAGQLLLPPPPGTAQRLANKMTLYSTVASEWGRRAVVDSSKNVHEAIELARRWPDRVTVVLLVRDGRGVYLSHRKTDFSRPDSLNSWMSYYRRKAPLLARTVPDKNLIRLRYEDFAAAPEATGRFLCERLGLDYVNSMPALAGGNWHMVEGNRTRFSPASGVRLDERWKQELKGDERAYFDGRAGGLNRQLGYD